MIGNDCPDCGARLSSDRCRCGWQAARAPGRCEACNAIRKANDRPADFAIAAHCQRCDNHSPATTYFHDDGTEKDRGIRLCPACWIPALKRRAERDPISDTDRQRCMELIKGLDLRWPLKAKP